MTGGLQSGARGGGYRSAIALALVLVTATGLRLLSIRQEAVWYDEVMILLHLDSPNVVAFLRDALPRTPVPPGFMISEYLWSRVAGTEVLALRMWPLICGIAGLAVLFVLARRLLGARTALLAVLWVSFLYWHIHYSQEIRYYPLALLLCLLSMWSFVELCAAPNRRWLALQVAFNAAMVWTHPVTVFLCAAQFAFLLLFRRKHARLIAQWTGFHLVLGASLYAFLASLNQEAAFAQAAWINPPTLWGRSPSFRNLVSMFSGVITVAPTSKIGHAFYAIEPYTAAALIVIHAAGGVLGARAVFRAPAPTAETRRPSLTPRETATLLLLWLILPPVLVFLVSHAWKPMFIVRYVLFASIPLYLLLAHFLAARPRLVVAAAFALLLTHDALFYFPGPNRLPFDQLASTMESESTLPPLIYLDDMLGMAPIEYYWEGERPEFLPGTERDDVLSEKTRPPGKDIWLVFTDENRYQNFDRALREKSIDTELRYLGASKPFWLVRIHP